MGATFRADPSWIRPVMEDAMGRRSLAILALFALVVSLPATATAQTKDDTLVYALQSDMQNWDPPNSVLRESIILGYHVFDHLAARDLKTGKVGPSLATAWRNLDDTTWEVRLRPGVRFHDGTPFTARDVKASFDRVLDPERKLTARGSHVQVKYVRIRISPEQATQLAELISGGVDVIKAVPPDQMDVINKSGAARTSTSPILRTAMLQLDQAGRTGPNPFTDRRVRQAMNLAVDVDAIIKHVLNGLGDRTATTINPMAFGYDPTLKPYRQDVAAAKKLLADAGYPNGFEVGFQQGPPIVEPALPQTSEAIVADLAKAGIRTRRRYVGEIGPYVNLVRDGKAEPMFEWSWGYYSVFDADAILYDVMKCGEAYSYYCNKALDDLIIQGRSTLDQKKRAEVYAKIQRLVFDDAAYLFKWGLRGVWGISNRVEYQAPRDEIDRMFLVTPRTK